MDQGERIPRKILSYPDKEWVQMINLIKTICTTCFIHHFLLHMQGTDFCSTAGAEALSKRMKDGKQMCQDLEEFVKQRSEHFL